MNNLKFYRIIVKSILDKMGWDIDAKSTEGESSVFTIKFSKDEQ